MAMDKSAADAYVYAKASGMLAKSYVGLRARQLFSLGTLGELWAFLFKKEVPVVPETLLAKALEKEAFSRFLEEFKRLVECYARPSRLLLALLHSYDYENIKDIASALSLGEARIPEDVQDISPFNIIDYSKWPDLEAMTAGGPVSWLKAPPETRLQHVESCRLDCQYVAETWKAAKSVHPSCREAVMGLLGEKIRVDNAVWALRLRLYYGMARDEIVPLLAYSDERKRADDCLASSAIKTLDWALDDYGQWSKWKYSFLLNPHEEGSVWSIDSRWIANAYKKAYVRKAYRLFHLYPFTECPMVCWFIVKRNELDNIRTASESLRLGIESGQAMNLAGVSEVMNG